MPKYLQNQAGFTLIEMLVAITVMAFIMAGVVSILGQTLHLKEQDQRKLQVQMVGRQVLDKVTSQVKVCKSAKVEDNTLTLTFDDSSTIAYKQDGKKIKVTNTTSTKKVTSSNLTTGDMDVSEFLPSMDSSRVKISLTVSTPSLGKDGVLSEKLETTVGALPVSDL